MTLFLFIYLYISRHCSVGYVIPNYIRILCWLFQAQKWSHHGNEKRNTVNLVATTMSSLFFSSLSLCVHIFWPNRVYPFFYWDFAAHWSTNSMLLFSLIIFHVKMNERIEEKERVNIIWPILNQFDYLELSNCETMWIDKTTIESHWIALKRWWRNAVNGLCIML